MIKSYKAIANRYGYPIYVYDGDIYLSDWNAYNNQAGLLEQNRIYYKNHPYAGLKKYPRFYGRLSTYIVWNAKNTYSQGSPNITWILPDRKYRRKGLPVAFKNPQELANRFRLNLIVNSYGDIKILNILNKQILGDVTRLVANSFKESFYIDITEDKRALDPIIYYYM